MKKFILSLVIILIFALVLWVLGLVHLSIPGGSWTVIESKILGVDETAIDGDSWSWSWRWDKLMPTVVRLHKFYLAPYKADIAAPIKGHLFPSGKDYASVLEGEPDFSFEVTFYLEFEVKPAFLPELVKSGITPAELPDWYRETSGLLGERVARLILAQPDLLYQENFKEQILEVLRQEPLFQGLSVLRLVPQKVQLPDYELYQLAREYYLEMQKRKFQARLDELAMEQKRNLAALTKEMEIINNLDQYGALLSQYPILVDFLYLRNIKKEDFLELSRFKIVPEKGE